MRTRTWLVMVLLAGIFQGLAVSSGLGKEGPEETASAASAQQIAQWAKQLSADSFAERELATQKLIEAGLAAIEEVKKVASGAPFEESTRAFHILRKLAISGPEATEDATMKALEEIANDKTSPARQRAQKLFASLVKERAKLREELAKRKEAERLAATIAALRGLGASVARDEDNECFSLETGEAVEKLWHVTIDENCKEAEGKDLKKHLNELSALNTLVFRGKHIGDRWLKVIEGHKRLTNLELSHTSVTGEGIAALKSLPELGRLYIEYSPIGDDGLAHLIKMVPPKELEDREGGEWKGLWDIKLHGTKITPAAAARLRKATVVNTFIDYHRGGYLGVACEQTKEGCRIKKVRSGSPAKLVGFQVGDIVLAYNGKPVDTFETLQSLMAESTVDDEVTIKVRREGKSVSLDVMLAEWDVARQH